MNMRRVILMMALCLGMAACGSGNAGGSKTTEVRSQKDRVEVLYFHGKQRCATCTAIERNAREAIETHFADELGNGTVVFRSIDLSREENEPIAGRYEVTWSSLFVCNWKGGVETCENLTEYAFANARTAPEAFRSGVIEKVEAFLE